MFLIDDPVWGIIIVSSLSNMLVDVFGEVFFEYSVYYVKGYIPNFSIPGFDGSAAATGGEPAVPVLINGVAAPGGESAVPVLINGVAPTPEQIELLHTLLATLQAAQ
jgi:hypothetical protein